VILPGAQWPVRSIWPNHSLGAQNSLCSLSLYLYLSDVSADAARVEKRKSTPSAAASVFRARTHNLRIHPNSLICSFACRRPANCSLFNQSTQNARRKVSPPPTPRFARAQSENIQARAVNLTEKMLSVRNFFQSKNLYQNERE
jgi:hypothetical protein